MAFFDSIKCHIIFIFFALLFSFNIINSGNPYGDDFAIFSTGYNLIKSGSYSEFDLNVSHRGLLTSLIFGIFYFLTNNIVFAHKLIIFVFSLSIITIFYKIKINGHKFLKYINPILFLIFPYILYVTRSPIGHLIQASFFLIFYYSLTNLFRSKTNELKYFFYNGLLLGLYALTHPYSLISSPLLFLTISYCISRLGILKDEKLKLILMLLAGYVIIIFGCIMVVFLTSGKFSVNNGSFELVGWSYKMYGTTFPVNPSSTFDILIMYIKYPFKFITEILLYNLKASYWGMSVHRIFFIFIIPFTILGLKKAIEKNTLEVFIFFSLLISYSFTTLLVYRLSYFYTLFIFSIIFASIGIETAYLALNNYQILSKNFKRYIIKLSIFILIAGSYYSYGIEVDYNRDRSMKGDAIIKCGEYLDKNFLKFQNQKIWTTTKKVHFFNNRLDYEYLPTATLEDKDDELNNLHIKLINNGVDYMIIENDHNNGKNILSHLYGDIINDNKVVTLPNSITIKSIKFDVIEKFINSSKSIYIIKIS